MARNYLNNFRTTLSAAITDTDTTWTLGTAPPALSVGDFYRFQLAEYATVNGVTTLVKSEFVDLADDGTLTRGVEGSTAQSWDAGDYVQLVATAESFASSDLANYLQKSGDTIQDVTIVQYAETTGTASSGAITMADGPVQELALGANTTLSFSDMSDGQNVTLHVTGLDSGWTLTFPVGAKVGTLPDLSSAVEAVFTVWMVGTQIYAVFVEEFS